MDLSLEDGNLTLVYSSESYLNPVASLSTAYIDVTVDAAQ